MGQSPKQSDMRKVLLVGDTTLDPLARLLERGQEPPFLKCHAAPFGQIFQILLDGDHDAWTHNPEIVVVWTAAQLSLPSFAKLLRFEFESATALHNQLINEVEQFAAAILKAASRTKLVLVPTWFAPVQERWIQSLTWRDAVGIANLLAKANLLLAERFAAQQNIILLDAGYWQASLNRPALDPRMFAVAKIFYSQPLFEKAATEIKSVLRGALGLTKKLVVCDLDNTLWGGVVGDDGPQNLKLGAPDPIGECFQSFQVALKGLSSRGILLAICSKNEEALAMSVIEEHPGMALRKSDFVAWRINWRDKAVNLAELAEELNLGLDSFVFLDDSAEERDQIRQILPEVYTPEMPKSPADFASFVASLDCFETLSLGKEDFERTAMYQQEKSRRDALDLSGDVENWLQSLHIQVHAAPLRRETLPRAAQLLNKTNQFNLSLRRMDETSFWNWAEEPCNSAYTFSVSDRFGDFGLAAVASVSMVGSEARIVDFVMSCRVMGKKVEEALLGYTVARAQAAGAARVLAPPVDGPRNQPAKGFFAGKFSSSASASIDPALVAIPPQITVREDN